MNDKITFQFSLSDLYYNDCSNEEFLEEAEENEIAKKELELKKARKREELAKRKEILASSKSSLPSGAQNANQDLLGLSRNDFLVWRRSHPGPKSKRAFCISGPI
ncbi:uncharacterized protein LOC124809059 isoform X4 [Hydra vulgaris]|uniref:uncharacterized protein LOC124809059 isoform X4 n=1 Tax=Hydra vulgaris TaxID=6087 RepID=UPI001F5F1FF3|nr:uncharacterized protein LOC124809059 [Hydra vulgaris]XP_047128508.1 uncharacterized protein LOC124809059 [Hydra vulgaris]